MAPTFRYGLLAAETLRDPGAFSDLGHAVADVEVIPHFDGRPDDMVAWLIFRTRDEAQTAKAPSATKLLDARAHDLLAARGFPSDALASFRLGFTSQPEIDEGGGRFCFFR